MTSPIWASDMLKTAARLAGMNAGPGRPALCDLRRATSTAYYALFHQLIRHGVLAAFPTSSEFETSRIARWFTHAGVRQSCGAVLVAASTNEPRREDREAVALIRRHPSAAVPDDLVVVAEAFAQLQDARHLADYSNEYDPVRYVTLDHVNTAERALRATWSMWRAGDSPRAARKSTHDVYSRFLHLALLRSGGPRSR